MFWRITLFRILRGPKRTLLVGETLALALILLTAGYLRLQNVGQNPGWYSDEGTNLDVASHLAHEQVQYMALGQSTLLVSRLPIFETLLELAVRLWGESMATLRTLTGLLGTLSVGVLYGCVRRITGKPVLALLAAFFLAVYPQAVLYSRFGFSYNLLPPFVMLSFVGLWEYLQNGRRSALAFAAGMIGLGTLSEVWMLALVPPFGLVVLWRRWRDAWWSLPLLGLPFALYSLWMVTHVAQAFTLDMQFVFFRVSNLPLPQQLHNVVLNYTTLLSQDFWMPCAVVGFILLHPARLRNLTLLWFFLTLIILGRTIALYSLSAHYMIPLLPFVAFGTASLVHRGLPYLWWQIAGSLQSAGRLPSLFLCASVCLFLVLSPFVLSLWLDMDHVRSGFPTAIDPFLTDPAQAQQVAAYLNANIQTDDLVIVNPALSWLLHARTADMQMAIAATGEGTVHFPPNIPLDRWVYDPRLEKARYVVIDNFWTRWAIPNIPQAGAIIAQVERWPEVFQTSDFAVYHNPAWSS
ncbi:MAG TPA: glycosyltransferase family 39 protein [Aggregatilineales bacterium]|nr:glycosyltransferase family 39 protein [Aggregatilineales bacterium]